MCKYKKKPIVIEAIQFIDDKSYNQMNRKWGKDFSSKCFNLILNSRFSCPISFTIKTLEGKYLASKNDYIIKGIKGEFYPCKPDIFEASYEKVEDEENAN